MPATQASIIVDRMIGYINNTAITYKLWLNQYSYKIAIEKPRIGATSLGILAYYLYQS